MCTKNNNLASIASDLSSAISYSCGSTASEDQASARTVLSGYCDQDNLPSFPKPATPVEFYITDIPEFTYLAPCAASAVSYAVNTMAYYNCPSDAPLLASCACSKNQNSLVVSQIINTSARSSCSGHTADVSSAQAFFKAYCALNSGTSSFPSAADPPGDMTYYIMDLPEYSSLAPCAYRALSYAVQYQTYYFCPEGPKALASCACFKDGVASDISSIVRSSVKYGCGGVATDDITSALSVFDFYCSAAKAQVTPAGITNSVEQTYASRTGGSNEGGGGGGGSGGGPQETGASDGGVNGGSGSSQNDKNGKNTKSTSGPGVGVIAGVVVGVIAVLAIVVGVVIFVVRKKKQQALAQQEIPDHPPPPANGMPDFYNGKQELAGNPITAPMPPPSPSPSTLKVAAIPGRVDNVSPISAHASAFTPPPHKAELHGQGAPYPPMPNGAELHGQTSPYHTMPNSAELQGQTSPYPSMPNSAELYAQGAMYPPPNRPELQGQGSPHFPPQNRPELQGQGSPHFPPPNRPELQGQGSPHFPPPRPEFTGYYNPQQQGQMQQMQGYQQGYVSPQNLHSPGVQGQQPPIELSPMSWHSGPVPGLHEMDGNARGQAR